ncbi:alpha/beta fold hydrolase [Haloferula sp. BvORR071]|uniref:esterase/lipase family protein n=1 Tax=Haloferula sp. BvORR071 TaxID=1396141 RepID=UPI002240FEAB|nr:alpha/beta fold hydrolase [Haloferula sp. BvORR071]
MPRRILCTISILLFAGCAAPVSYTHTHSPTPKGDYVVSPLSDALRELEAGKADKNPILASGHFFDCARLAGAKALEGETGAVALYNHAVARLVESLEQAKSLPWDRAITVGSGEGARTLRGKLEPGAPRVERQYLAADNLSFKGKYAKQAIRPGVGACLVALSPANKDFRKTYDLPKSHAALTAVLRFQNEKDGTLELHDPFEEERIAIAGRNPSLAADFGAPVSMSIAVDRPDKLGLIRLLNPQKYSDTARLMRLQKYDKNRIPVLLVHGLQDTPVTWAPMYLALINDPEIRERYQFWVFSYPSGYPYPYSASLLRKELDGIDKEFPDHKDIVIVGHSMGSLISRLMVTDAGDKLWLNLFGHPPEQTKVSGPSRQLLVDSLIFTHRKNIHRAIFISAPHKGSGYASNWIGRLGSRLVRVPSFLADARDAVSSVMVADSASMVLERAPNSIDTLSPNNRFVKAISAMPIAPGVTYHSIMGDRGKGDTPNSSDGVVPYWSSHLEGAASEKIVPSNHSAHQNPEGIEEVRRILKLNAKVEH